jgi:DNA-binding NarL/FixJ family response regulator
VKAGGRFGESRDHDDAPLLTPREVEVLRAVSEGLTNKEMRAGSTFRSTR